MWIVFCSTWKKLKTKKKSSSAWYQTYRVRLSRLHSRNTVERWVTKNTEKKSPGVELKPFSLLLWPLRKTTNCTSISSWMFTILSVSLFAVGPILLVYSSSNVMRMSPPPKKKFHMNSEVVLIHGVLYLLFVWQQYTRPSFFFFFSLLNNDKIILKGIQKLLCWIAENSYFRKNRHYCWKRSHKGWGSSVWNFQNALCLFLYWPLNSVGSDLK